MQIVGEGNKLEQLPEEVPVLRLTFDESRKLMAVSERYRHDNPRFYATQSVGLAGLLDDILMEKYHVHSDRVLYENDPEFRGIAEKIKDSFNDSTMDWRYVDFPQEEEDLNDVIDRWVENSGRPSWIDEQTGDLEIDPLPGACIGGDYAENYAQRNEGTEPFVFFAYNTRGMVNCPLSWNGMTNRRLVPENLPTDEDWANISDEDQAKYHKLFAEQFRGAIVFQFDILYSYKSHKVVLGPLFQIDQMI